MTTFVLCGNCHRVLRAEDGPTCPECLGVIVAPIVRVQRYGVCRRCKRVLRAEDGEACPECLGAEERERLVAAEIPAEEYSASEPSRRGRSPA